MEDERLILRSDGDSVNSNEADAVPANGHIYTNCAIDNPMEIGTSLASTLVDTDTSIIVHNFYSLIEVSISQKYI